MQAALDFFLKVWAGIANFLYAQITGAKDIVVETINAATATLVKTVQGIQDSVAEGVKAQDERLSQIQQQNKDNLSELASISKRQDELRNYEGERFDGLQNLAVTLYEKVSRIEEATKAGIDNQAIEDTFYKHLHGDIAKYVNP